MAAAVESVPPGANDSEGDNGLRPLGLAAFVGRDAALTLRHLVPGDHLCFAQSWADLERLLRAHSFSAVALDPAADGQVRIEAAVFLLRMFPCTPFFAYVPGTAGNLRVVFTLSQHGLRDAFAHPIADPHSIRRVVDKFFGNALVRELLAPLELGFVCLPPDVSVAIYDLFQRPQRYRCAADLAIAAQTSVRTLYRKFASCSLGNPKKMVVVAKVLRGYAYLRSLESSVEEVSTKLGYSSPHFFARHTAMSLYCRPSALAAEARHEEVVRGLLEWLYKPTDRTQQQGKSANVTKLA